MRWLQRRLHRLWMAWIAVQVEFQGRYPVKRLQRLNNYCENLGNLRLLAICLLTPLPCLALAVVIESVPLAPPEDGICANWVFVLRYGVITCIMVGTMVYHMGHNVPSLTVKLHHIVIIGLLSGVAAAVTLFAVASATVFPVPFTMLLASPPSMLVFGVCFIIFWGAQFRSKLMVKVEMDQNMKVLNCQLTLTLIYPLYIFGFTSLDGIRQTLFVMVLPVIKVAAKNWISRALTGYNHLKPEAVIFNVEVFHALYISNAIQNASSRTSTSVIMAVDVIHFILSIMDILEILNDVRVLMKKIPRGHPIAKENFVQVAIRFIAMETNANAKRKTSDSKWIEPWVSSKKLSYSVKRKSLELVTLSSSQMKVSSNKARIFPIKPHRNWLRTGVDPEVPEEELKSVSVSVVIGLDVIFSRQERALFIQKSARILFITEYIVLTEYVEVVLPIIYCLHRVILFNLPNHAYYPSLTNLSISALTTNVQNVMVYGALEFISMIVAVIVLKRMLGFLPLRQLAFVLEKQGDVIQSRLMSVFIYVMQILLVHLGADFSFKFAWLHDRPSS